MQFLSIAIEADNLQAIAGKLALHEGMQGERHFFGGGKAAVILHGEAHVQQQHRGRAGEKLRPVYFKVLGLELHRRPITLPRQRVHQCATEVGMKAIAILVRFGRIGVMEIATAMKARVVWSELATLQEREDMTEGPLA